MAETFHSLTQSIFGVADTCNKDGMSHERVFRVPQDTVATAIRVRAGRPFVRRLISGRVRVISLQRRFWTCSGHTQTRIQYLSVVFPLG